MLIDFLSLLILLLFEFGQNIGPELLLPLGVLPPALNLLLELIDLLLPVYDQLPLPIHVLPERIHLLLPGQPQIPLDGNLTLPG